jgi:hypothetical protein
LQVVEVVAELVAADTAAVVVERVEFYILLSLWLALLLTPW